jgi:dTDP-4-amino-4,6-dideoxygalactose transaminase
VFGNGCEVEEIQTIAKKYGLKVIYDAAHAFDVKYKQKSILTYGDISTLSFHATKLFHTIEGGALIINDDELVKKARYLINFGFENEESIPHLGINAKMNEFEAAMGLCILEDMDVMFKNRKEVYEIYQSELDGHVRLQKINNNTSNNYSYFPIILQSREQLLSVKNTLNSNNINPRRYFYPSLDTLSYIEPKQNCRISRDISQRILCLPMYSELDYKEQELIIKIVKDSL